MLSARVARSVLASIPPLVLGIAATTVRGVAQALPPQLRYSTHDWLNPLPDDDTRDAWVDVKAPGDGRVYAVGTTELREFLPGMTTYSGGPVDAFPGATGFAASVAGPRQTVVLQVTDAAQAIVWQQFFYGLPENEPRPSNARAVSVWADANLGDTRVAICGESFCPILPLSQDPAGILAPATSGFIAVYDGNGVLLWTHHFFETFANGNGAGACAITDVSIRVEGDTDVVTYCGISTYGDFQGQQPWLDPVAPFAAPGNCATAAAGNSNSGLGQWDGIVGRLRNSHGTPTVGGVSQAVTEFHSIVGGREQDGLFGIAEIDADRFVVVGTTGALVGSGGAFTFPLTTLCLGAMTDESVGTMLAFDASTLAATGLVLEQSIAVGSDPGLQDGRHTVLRDVVAQDFAFGFTRVVAVGSTDDPGIGGSWALSGQVAPGGGVDGVLVSALFLDPAPGFALLIPESGRYRGGAMDDVLTGVQAWNEFDDAVTVTGFTSDAMTPADIEVESTYFDSLPGATQPAEFRTLTAIVYGGTDEDRPTVLGAWSATPEIGGNAWERFGIGDPAGGGVAVGDDGRSHVVGATLSLDYPITPGLPAARPKVGVLFDGVRAAIDLLPVGVGRTDGTGDVGQPPTMPYPPAPPITGGTSPECATGAFGQRIGVAAPPLLRMQIDYDGAPPAALAGGTVGPRIVVSRPPDGAQFMIAGLSLGFPGAPTFAPMVLPEGLAVWTLQNPATVSIPIAPPPAGWEAGRVLHFDIFPLPAGNLTFSVQLMAALAAPIPGGLPPACGGVSSVAGSPALWISY